MSMSTKVGNFAFYSRILVFLMQVLFNLVIPDHDAKVFSPPSMHKQRPLDYYAEVLVEGFRRWDGVYFHHIAEHGYTYENTLVFFPLFPLMVRIVANTLLYPFQFVVSYGNTLTLAAFVVNLVIFVKSAQILYQLSLHVLGDERLAFKTAQLYCINPASIFFSACYSETLFAYLTFKGMLNLEKGQSVTGSLWFGFSALTRSNGLVNAGFLLHQKLLESVKSMKSLRSADFVEKKTMFIATVTSVYLILGSLLIQLVLCVVPFCLYQYYAYTIFCNRDATYKDLKPHILNYGNKQGYKMPHTGVSPWCSNWFPYSYGYVQANHWEVGFMSYWHFKQIPNFLLATPIVLLSLAAILNYAYHNIGVCLSLGLHQARRDKDSYKKTDKESALCRVGFHQREVFVYLAELTFLLLFGIFFMHIQVLTRFLCSSSPVIYWFIAHTTTPPEKICPPKYNKLDVFSHLKQRNTTGTDDSTQKQPDNYTETDESSLQGSQVGDQGGSMGVPPGTSEVVQNKSVTASVGSNELSMNDFDDMYDWDSNNWLHRAIFIYMHLYFFVGIAAFSNFLPWT